MSAEIISIVFLLLRMDTKASGTKRVASAVFSPPLNLKRQRSPEEWHAENWGEPCENSTRLDIDSHLGMGELWHRKYLPVLALNRVVSTFLEDVPCECCKKVKEHYFVKAKQWCQFNKDESVRTFEDKEVKFCGDCFHHLSDGASKSDGHCFVLLSEFAYAKEVAGYFDVVQYYPVFYII